MKGWTMSTECNYCKSENDKDEKEQFTDYGQDMTICTHHKYDTDFWKWFAGQLYDELDKEFVNNRRVNENIAIVKEAIPKITKLVIDVKDDAVYELGYLAGRIE